MPEDAHSHIPSARFLSILVSLDRLTFVNLGRGPVRVPVRAKAVGLLGNLRDPYRVRSASLSSQLPVSLWHEQIGDLTVADGILDRLVDNTHGVEVRGDSMRKNWGKPSPEQS